MIESIMSPNSLGFILVFLEGIISFFSPCVIPLIPIYISYLAGNGEHINEDGTVTYQRKIVFLYTVFFVLGISFAFFILAMSFTALGQFFHGNKLIFTRVGGIVIILLGLFQLGFFDFKFLNKERKFQVKIDEKKMNPIMAFIMGFTFSFAWTPCVGPALSSVLILASSSSNAITGNLLILVYAIGFIIPFLLLGLFTTQVLNFINKHKNLLKYIVKIGGVILILIGVMTFTGWMNNISGYLNSFGTNQQEIENIGENKTSQDIEIEESQEEYQEAESQKESQEEDQNELLPAMNFTLLDQYGNEHTLSDYKGKVVFLNFWATWCPPCKKEMPDIQEIYYEYGENQEDVIILGVNSPRSEENPNTREVDKKGVLDFLEENHYTFPTVFDETGAIFNDYFVSALPTTFMINKDSNIEGYAPGMLTKDMMKSIIEDTLKSSE